MQEQRSRSDARFLVLRGHATNASQKALWNGEAIAKAAGGSRVFRRIAMAQSLHNPHLTSRIGQRLSVPTKYAKSRTIKTRPVEFRETPLLREHPSYQRSLPIAFPPRCSCMVRKQVQTPTKRRSFRPTVYSAERAKTQSVYTYSDPMPI